MRSLFLAGLFLNLFNPLVADLTMGSGLELEGVMIWVDDLETARDFYVDILGFQLKDQSSEERALTLTNGGLNLYLRLSKKQKTWNYHRDARTALTIQVTQLLPAIDQLRKAGIHFEETQLQRNGVGVSIPLYDPAGNLLSLMEVQTREVAPFEGFRIYNLGITSADMEGARAFYIQKLGFEAWSLDYLPAALPLKHDSGSFAFMLHEKKGLVKKESAYGIENDLQLVFSCNNLEETRQGLDAKGIKATASTWNEALIFKDPFGNFLHLKQK